MSFRITLHVGNSDAPQTCVAHTSMAMASNSIAMSAGPGYHVRTPGQVMCVCVCVCVRACNDKCMYVYMCTEREGGARERERKWHVCVRAMVWVWVGGCLVLV